VSFTRIANSPRRGLGQTSLARVLAHAAAVDVSVWEAAGTPEAVPGLGAAAVKALGRFMGTMADLRGQSGLPAGEAPGGEGEAPSRAEPIPVAELLEAVLAQTGYVEALEADRTIEAQGRLENLEQLVEVAREFDAAAPEEEDTLDVFLQEIALVADADSRSEDEGLVTLMTLHNAKGLEYPVVFITGCEDGVFPHSRAIDEGELEEERRLFYVGVTRAMRQLYLTYARRRAVFGAVTNGMRSRFLDEIPTDLLDQPQESPRGWGAGRLGGLHQSVGASPAATAAARRGPASEAWAESRTAEGPGAGAFRLGEDVVHAAFGEGVVTGVEPDGVIVVRFAGDGSERKLMAEYAPVSHR